MIELMGPNVIVDGDVLPISDLYDDIETRRDSQRAMMITHETQAREDYPPRAVQALSRGAVYFAEQHTESAPFDDASDEEVEEVRDFRTVQYKD